MNVMLVSVSQRTAEVGSVKAIGATRHQITALFLTEAILLRAPAASLVCIVGFAVGLDRRGGSTRRCRCARRSWAVVARNRHCDRERSGLRTHAGEASGEARSRRSARQEMTGAKDGLRQEGQWQESRWQEGLRQVREERGRG